MRKVYTLANSTSVPLLSTNLLQALFVNLKDDALAFLAGLWTSSPLDNEGSQSRLTSLRHAAAFLEAHKSMDDFVDFQTILPSLIVVLQAPDMQEREAASEYMAALLRLTAKRFSTVYGFDTIYGESSGQQ
jgi:U3 small nucleolar RNA-associated protein 10